MLVKLKETGDLITLNFIDFTYGNKTYVCMKGLYVCIYK